MPTRKALALMSVVLASHCLVPTSAGAQQSGDQPNILVIWGDDVGNLRADPFERAWHESEMYLRWMAENMWLFVPAQTFTRQWLESFKEFPPKGGTTLGIDGVIKRLESPAARQ